MNFDNIILDEYVPSCECLQWLTGESFRLWKLSDKAAENHNWQQADFLMKMANLVWEARERVWNDIMRNTKLHWRICKKINDHRLAAKKKKKVKSYEV